EKKLIKPYYTTAQFERYSANPNHDLWIIYTPSSFNKPDSMHDYSNLKAHLDRFAKVITSDNKPYGLHRARKEQFFKGEKIIVQRKCPQKPVFTYTDFDTYVSATFYIIQTTDWDMKFLTGLLNSRLIEFWLRHKGKMQGNNFQIDKEPLLQIPIAKPTKTQENKISKIVNQIISQKQKNSKADTTDLEAQIDAMVYELYNLNDEEIQVIQRGAL
ncbi:MAG: hypothetical protein JJT94_00065, partial [Bernardetiaceae bacterium]|nr:hypothetical protein [Bernardetiaceae bacterium]